MVTDPSPCPLSTPLPKQIPTQLHATWLAISRTSNKFRVVFGGRGCHYQNAQFWMYSAESELVSYAFRSGPDSDTWQHIKRVSSCHWNEDSRTIQFAYDTYYPLLLAGAGNLTFVYPLVDPLFPPVTICSLAHPSICCQQQGYRMYTQYVISSNKFTDVGYSGRRTHPLR